MGGHFGERMERGYEWEEGGGGARQHPQGLVPTLVHRMGLARCPRLPQEHKGGP